VYQYIWCVYECVCLSLYMLAVCVCLASICDVCECVYICVYKYVCDLYEYVCISVYDVFMSVCV
jgi:hypothetical protein